MADEAPGKERAYLVRTLIANLKIKKPSPDQAGLRRGLCKKFYASWKDLQPTHFLRVYEAICGVDFPEPEVAALRDHVGRRLGVFGRLKDFREVMIPGQERYQGRPAEPTKAK